MLDILMCLSCLRILIMFWINVFGMRIVVCLKRSGVVIGN